MVYTASEYLVFTRVIIIIVVVVAAAAAAAAAVVFVVFVVVTEKFLFCLDTSRHCKFGWFAADCELVPAF